MKLFFKKSGVGKPLIILHGLFGLSDNWSSLSKAFAENGFCCYVVDLRNHGRSPHSFEFNFKAMAADLFEFMEDEKIYHADFIGHSLGGKVLMFFSEAYPQKIRKMVVADIAPRFYPPHHQAILSALHDVHTDELKSRKEAEEQLRTAISDEATVQFLLKNLYWNEENKLDWRFGLNEIEKNIEEVGKAFQPVHSIALPVLFLRGEQSGYINTNDEFSIKEIFPLAEIRTIPGAGHWIHAEKPAEFMKTVLQFLKK